MIVIFIEILCAVLLLVMATVIGYTYGRASAKEEKTENASNVSTFYNSLVDEARVKEIVAEIAKPTQTCKFNRDLYNRLKILWEIHEQKTETPDDEIGLTSRMSALEDRMKRIERKGGLSV